MPTLNSGKPVKPFSERLRHLSMLERRLTNAIKNQSNKEVFEALHDITQTKLSLKYTEQDHLFNYLINFDNSKDGIDFYITALIINLNPNISPLARSFLKQKKLFLDTYN
ncbi:hypothetical protein GJX59_23610 [Salmonella enterica]|nr:hypothetical protein [Salmonella enterica]EGK9716144.1 hypothetical protein [Salmonella enterica]ELF4594591.1 hypothetical protein [Salmonella enterica]